MPSMTNSEYLAYLARAQRQPGAASAGCDDEAELHQQISAECLRRGWLAFHGSMAHRTFRTEGEPDFVILRPGGVLLVEAKTKAGKLSPGQLAVQCWAAKLGHAVAVVRSFEEFCALCESR